MNAQVEQIGSIEAFLASGERLYQRQRARLAEEEHHFQLARFDKQMAYEKRMRQLMAEHDDAMRELERTYAKSRADGERMLAALQAMREG